MALARAATRASRPTATFRQHKRSKTSATTRKATTVDDSAESESDAVSESSFGSAEAARTTRTRPARQQSGSRGSARSTKLNRSASASGSGRRNSLPRPPPPKTSGEGRRGTRRSADHSLPSPPVASTSRLPMQDKQSTPGLAHRLRGKGKALSVLPVNHAVARTRANGKAPAVPVAVRTTSGSTARARSSSTRRGGKSPVLMEREDSRGLKRKRSKAMSEMDVSEEDDDDEADEDVVIDDSEDDEEDLEERRVRSGRRLRNRSGSVEDEEESSSLSEQEDDDGGGEDEDDVEMGSPGETDDHYIYLASLAELRRERRVDLLRLACIVSSRPKSAYPSSTTKEDLITIIMKHRASSGDPDHEADDGSEPEETASDGGDADSPRPYTSHEGSPAGRRTGRRAGRTKASATKKWGQRRKVAHVPTPPPSDPEEEDEETEDEDDDATPVKPVRRRTKSMSAFARSAKPNRTALIGRKSVPNAPAARANARTRAGLAKAGDEASRKLRNGKSIVVRQQETKAVKFSRDADEEETEQPNSSEEEAASSDEEEQVAASLTRRRGSRTSGTGSSPMGARRAGRGKAAAKAAHRGKAKIVSPTTSDVADESDQEDDSIEPPTQVEADAMDDEEEDEASEAETVDDGSMEVVEALRAPRKLRNGKVVASEPLSEPEEDGTESEEQEDEEMAEATSEDDLAHATEGTLARLKKDDLIRLCEERDLDAEGTKRDLATALLQWRDQDFDHSSNDDSSSHSTISQGSTETVKDETKTQALGAAATVRNRNGSAPLLMRNGHSSSPEKPRTAHQSKKNEEEEVNALDLESLQLQDKEIQWDKLIKLEKVGSGGFKDVFKGTYRRKTIAIAEIRGHLTDMDIKELGLLRDLRHPNIVHFIGVSIPKEPSSSVPVSIITELCANGDLFDYLRAVPHPSFSQMLDIMLGISKGVEYLHNSKPAIIHRDIKSSNVLITAQGKAKINDFGLARVKNSTKSMVRSLVGTVNWQAPELWVPKPNYNEKVDVYSVGLVYWEMLQWHQPVKRYPFEGMNEHAIYDYAGREKKRPSTASMGRQWGREILNLIEAMWHPEASQRPPMSQVTLEIEVMLRAEKEREKEGLRRGAR